MTKRTCIWKIQFVCISYCNLHHFSKPPKMGGEKYLVALLLRSIGRKTGLLLTLRIGDDATVHITTSCHYYRTDFGFTWKINAIWSNLKIYSSISMLFSLISGLIATFVCGRFRDFLSISVSHCQMYYIAKIWLKFLTNLLNASDHPFLIWYNF